MRKRRSPNIALIFLKSISLVFGFRNFFGKDEFSFIDGPQWVVKMFDSKQIISILPENRIW
jgi:hypothetical protein